MLPRVFFIIMVLFFFIFSSLLIIASFRVVTVENPVYAVLYLVLCFCNAGVLLLLVEAEYLALLFVIVYVGAIAVLFLFVVIILNISVRPGQASLYSLITVQHLPLIFVVIGSLVILFFCLLIGFSGPPIFKSSPLSITKTYWFFLIDFPSNAILLSYVLYSHFFICFLVAGLVLLVSIIGSLVLTLPKNARSGTSSLRVCTKKQLVFYQLSRTRSRAVFDLNNS